MERASMASVTVAPEEVKVTKSSVLATEVSMSNFASGVLSPRPKSSVESSQKKLELSCWRIQEAPANNTDPAVGTNQVGAPAPPETRAWPEVPTAESSNESASE